MHVLLIHQAFVGPNEPGGTRHFEFAKHLDKKGDRLSVVASTVSLLSGKRARAEAFYKEVLDGIDVVRAFTYDKVHKSFAHRVAAFLSFSASSVAAAMSVKDVDVVMGTTPPIFQAGSAMVVSKLKNKPFLLEVRDLWPDFAIEMGVLKDERLIWVARQFEALLYEHATHILVNSPAYRDVLIEKKGVPPSKVSLISNGVDPEMFDPDLDGSAFRHEQGLDDDDLMVTYAGALGQANDIPVLLRAMQQLTDRPHIQLVLVGDGKERPNLEAMCDDMNLTNVRFTGSLPKPKMAEVLAASDVCTACLQDIPLFRTTYPNKVFDYMAAARPIVLAIDGVIRQVVDDADCGISVPPGDPKAVADALRQLDDDRSGARVMGRRGRTYVEQHFNRAKQAEKFRRLVQAIVDGRPPLEVVHDRNAA